MNRMLLLTFIGAALMLALAPVIEANTPQVPLHLGRIWTNPEYDGAEGWGGSVVQYPGGIPRLDPSPWPIDPPNHDVRRWVGHGQKRGTYLFTTNWTDPDGITHTTASSYFFRSMNYDYPPEWVPGTADTTFNYLYAGGVQAYNRFDRPNVYVDGHQVDYHPGADSLATLPDHSGRGSYPFDITDPDLTAERVITTWWQYIPGVRLERTQYAYPKGTPHQDYILEDITLTNDGVSGNRYPGAGNPPVLENQTLNGVVWVQAYDYRNSHAEGVMAYQDNHAMNVRPFGDAGHSAVLFWDGDSDALGVPGAEPGPDYGDPPIPVWHIGYYQGHLLGNAHVMQGPVFVSESPAAFDTDLPDQPAFRLIWGERGVDFAGEDYSPSSAGEQRAIVISSANHMAIGVDARDDARTAFFMTDDRGGTSLQGYGPLRDGGYPAVYPDEHGWTLGFNESVRIVQVLAAGGLERDTAAVLGRNWLDRRDAGTTPRQTPEEIELILSGADTAYKAMNMAYWNFHGEFAPNVTADSLESWGIAGHELSKPPGRSAFDVPDGPRPPANFSVRARDEGGVELRWSMEAETTSNHDTGVEDFSHYRVYRQEGSRHAPWEILVDEVPADWLTIAEADGNVPFTGRVLFDNTVEPGVDYWYAVVAVNDGSQNWAQPGGPLKSSRWWTWTGYLPMGVVPGPPGAVDEQHPARFALAQNAPNPFNPVTTIRFSVAEAGAVRLAIYDVNGRLVRTLVDGAVAEGHHEAVWDSRDNLGRAVASGVYVYRLTSGDNIATRRMVLVR